MLIMATEWWENLSIANSLPLRISSDWSGPVGYLIADEIQSLVLQSSMKMHWSSERYIVILLLLFVTNFATNFADDVTDERKTLAKVLTSFLRVPWINLNSSWTDEVASNCSNDISTLFESANAGEMWAVKMLDAASKVPAGIITGNNWDLGMFDECIAVKGHDNPANIQGQHCMVSLSIPTKFFGDTSIAMRIQKVPLYNPSANNDLSLSMSVCVPSSCSVEDIKRLVNASIETMPELTAFEVGVAKVSCSSPVLRRELTLGSTLAFSFFAVLLGTLLFCTICDLVLRLRSEKGPTALKNAAKFSIYTSMIKLSNTKLSPGTLPSIHGIRVLSLFMVILGHRAFTILLQPTVNAIELHELTETPLSALIFTLPFGVDTFFLMSGFLTGYLFLKAMRSERKPNIFAIYIHRYVRLTPCIAILLLFVIFVLPYLGSGPSWELVSAKTITFCERNWWINLLYVQNFVKVDEICLLHTWYVAVEMQLLWLSPIILYPLFYRPKFGLVLLGLLTIASIVTPAAQLVINRWSAFFAMERGTPEIFSQFLNSYPATYNRALPYLIGIILAYDILNKRRKISKMQVTLNWIVSALFVIFCGWSAGKIQPNALGYDAVYEAIYVSVARVAWSIAMAWLLYACIQGYGGPVTKFLSLPMFVPLSRLCYCIYLVHFVLQISNTAALRIAQHITPLSLMYTFFGDYAISMIAALVLCLCFESPMIALEGFFSSRRSPPSSESDSTTKEAGLSKAMQKYLGEIEGRVEDDSFIATITSRQDFWRIISDELNTLSEGHSKTPTEWSKAWRVWRSELSKMNSIFETRRKSIPNEESQPQTGIVVLEQELMVFMAAVNSRLNEGENYKESNVMKSKSQSDTCKWRHSDSNSFDNMRSKLSGPVSPDVEHAPQKTWNLV